jgi:hypothetical protein
MVRTPLAWPKWLDFSILSKPGKCLTVFADAGSVGGKGKGRQDLALIIQTSEIAQRGLLSRPM